MINKVIEDALTFDDILIKPRYSETIPARVNLQTKFTRNINLNIPLISAAMDTVTESSLAIALAHEGGIGIIHKNMSIQQQVQEVRKVKKFEAGVVGNPICIKQNETLKNLENIRKKYNISSIPVIDQNDDISGIITNRDTMFQTNKNLLIKDLMTPKNKLITVQKNWLDKQDPDQSIQKIKELMGRYRIEKIIVLNKNKVLGLYTANDIKKSTIDPNSCKDNLGSLRVAAAIGTQKDTLQRAKSLIDVGVDCLVLDTAHGHSKKVFDTFKTIKNNYPDIDVVVGNIATKEAAKDLLDLGVDGIKIGIGPGSICTTRIISGIGIPQITAIIEVANYVKNEIPIIADGGIRFSGDIAKAICAGANSVMIGNLFAGTKESPGEIVLYKGRSYKEYRGMGSLGAMSEKYSSKDRYFQEDSIIDTNNKLVPEGIEGRVPYKGELKDIVLQLTGGLRASMGYAGVSNIQAFIDQGQFVKISPASVKENHVHDVTITREAPNYHIN